MSIVNASELESKLTDAKSKFGEDDIRLVEPLEQLAYAYHTLADYHKAEDCYRQVVRLRQADLMHETPALIDVFHGLAILMRIQNRFEEAEPFYLEAIELTGALYGDSHPETLSRKNYLAGLYFAWGRYDRARTLVEESKTLYSAHYGSTHEVVGVAAMALALICNRQNNGYEANQYFKEALRLLPAGPRGSVMLDFKDLAASLFFLSKEKYKQGMIEEAETLFRYSLIIETDRLWPGHRIVGDNVQLLGDLYRSQYMSTEAEFLYRKALEIRRNTMGDDHLDVAVSANSLGTLLFDNRRYEEAATFLMDACDIRGKAGFPPLLANSLRAYAACLRQLHRHEEADQCELKARNIYDRYNPS
jgi:tetratricopeptide (TPR) repeat protein